MERGIVGQVDLVVVVEVKSPALGGNRTVAEAALKPGEVCQIPVAVNARTDGAKAAVVTVGTVFARTGVSLTYSEPGPWYRGVRRPFAWCSTRQVA